ncbi:autophagy-related protein 11-like protein [Lates japonicus]|uniref:Autophagy-related protein 11-like protein n=1 Tax=Lates japonicus TaxID=270547 RepID=A0AAD3M258_LATJO|nr:autophagy-related protein 11-like protein [Lates japonicus]
MMKRNTARERNSRPADTADRDSRVKSYVENWEMEVSRKLILATTEFRALSDPSEKARLQTNIETLGAVLDLLQGKRITKITNADVLRDEIAYYKQEWCITKAKYREVTQELCNYKKAIENLKVQLDQDRVKIQEAEKTIQDLRLQLKEVPVSSSPRPSPEATNNMDLSFKLEDNLRTSMWSLDISIPEFNFDDLEEEAPKDEDWMGLSDKKEEEEKLQEITDTTVYHMQEENDTTQKSQTTDSAKLQAAMNVAEETDNKSNEESDNRPRRRNWFVRMFQHR